MTTQNYNDVSSRPSRTATEQALAQQTQERAKQVETRRKIQQGSLISVAGLDEEPTAVLLGLLLEAKATLMSKQGDDIRRRWWSLGDKALSDSDKAKSDE